MVATQKNYACETIPSTETSFFFSRDLEEKKVTPRISVIILAYRSGNSIRDFIESMVKSLDKNEPDWEIILVGNYFAEDGDPTPGIVSAIARNHPRIRAVTRIKKGMMGWDMKSGMEVATGRTIAVIDGDGQMPFENVMDVYKKLRDEGLDLAKTYRTTRGDGFYRKTISLIYNVIFNILFPGLNIRDINSKPKIITREAYDCMELKSNGWFIDAEIMIQASNLELKVGEVPTYFRASEREGGSFINLFTFLEFLKNLIRFKIIQYFSDRK